MTKAELKWSDYKKVQLGSAAGKSLGGGGGGGGGAWTAASSRRLSLPPAGGVQARRPGTAAPRLPVARSPARCAAQCVSHPAQVPVIVIDGEQVNDSSAIISRLAAEIEASQDGGAGGSSRSGSSKGSGGGLLASLFGGGKAGGSTAGGTAGGAGGGAPESRAEEEKWRRWVDDWFVKVGRHSCQGRRVGAWDGNAQRVGGLATWAHGFAQHARAAVPLMATHPAPCCWCAAIACPAVTHHPAPNCVVRRSSPSTSTATCTRPSKPLTTSQSMATLAGCPAREVGGRMRWRHPQQQQRQQ